MTVFKNSKKIIYRHFEYFNSIYIEPHLLSDDAFQEQILKKLYFINKEGGYNFAYGIFNPSLTLKEIKEICQNLIITICEVNGIPVAGCYQYKFNNKVNDQKILHVGLLISTKNPGRDITFCLKKGIALYFESLQEDFLLTNISADPYFIGVMARNSYKAWPSPFTNNQRPHDKSYKDVAQTCFNEYVKNFFPFPENLSLDLKRFTLQSKAIEMGFETDMRQMVRDPELIVNLFSMFWLDYSKQEILLQVGIFNKEMKDKICQEIETEVLSVE